MTKKKPEKTKKQKIKELKIKINEAYSKAGTHRKKYLIYALHCGEGLLEIKSLLEHGEWQQWIADNFDGSHKTAATYMGVAKHWGDTRMVAMREKDIGPETIKGFYDVLKDKPDPDGIIHKEKPTPRNPQNMMLRKRYRKYIMQRFRAEVNDLDTFQLAAGLYRLIELGDNFDYFWNNLYSELKKVAAELQRKAAKKRAKKRS